VPLVVPVWLVALTLVAPGSLRASLARDEPPAPAPATDERLAATELQKPVAGIPVDGVLATVDGVSITADDTLSLVFLSDPEPLFGALEQAIRKRLVVSEASRLGVDVGGEVLEKRVAEVLKKREDDFHFRYGPEAQFFAYLQERYGVEREAYLAILRDVALENLLLERLVRHELRRRDRVRLRALFVDELEKATELHSKLKEGANFAALARRESKDRGTAQQGGLYPPLPADLEHPLVAAVRGLESGALAEVGTTTARGRTVYWIVKLEGRIAADSRPYGEQREEIERELLESGVAETEIAVWDDAVRKRHEVAIRLGRNPAAEGAGGR
jgi:parvulin-like peptidyl-prolyl isomerase